MVARELLSSSTTSRSPGQEDAVSMLSQPVATAPATTEAGLLRRDVLGSHWRQMPVHLLTKGRGKTDETSRAQGERTVRARREREPEREAKGCFPAEPRLGERTGIKDGAGPERFIFRLNKEMACF